MNVIRQLAAEFIEENRDYYGSKDYLPKARQAIHDIDSKADRIQFLSLLLEDQVSWITKHRHDGCDNPDCSFEKAYIRNHYFLNQELKRIGVRVDEDGFTSEERDTIMDRLDQILNELEQIKDGQGIVAQDVEDLKDLMYLGKRRWKRQFAATVGEWVGAGMVSKVVVEPLVQEVAVILGSLPPNLLLE
ncbi:MAG TPA: hypothetical protein PKD45_05025 [Flavobacteriales bacterium]|nr:hypothetical protein [Flavobacteriales bacterium]